MSNPTRWLFTEIDRWVAAKVITPAQASQIRAFYPEAAPALAWGLIVFFGVGAVVAGLGVILLLAYNWGDIPKAGKLALIFGAIIAAHGFGLRLRERNDWRAWLGEALALLGTMLYGAAIWLIAQIYHINEHFPNGFLFWGLGALAMAWALPSIGQAILATVALTCWAGTEALDFDTPVHLAPLLLAAGVGPLVWRMRSAVLAAVLLAALYVTLLANVGEDGGGRAVLLVALGFSTLLLALGRLMAAKETHGGITRVACFFGWIGGLVCAYVLGFHDAADDLLRDRTWRAESWESTAIGWLIGGGALAAWAWILVRVRRGERTLASIEDGLLPAGLMLVHVVVLTGEVGEGVLVACVFNLAMLCVGAMWSVRGCREGRLAAVVRGTLLIGAVVFARYFDLFDSLAVRGAVFLAFGAALFAEGFYYRKARQTGDAGTGGDV